jgi:hypothetical protein
MEIMAHLANKKIIIMVLFLFLSTKNIGQQKIDQDITFSYKEEGKTRYMNIDVFLTNFGDNFSELIEGIKCKSASGLFKFEINPQSKIVNITVKGNLPETINEAIKNRIILSEKYWILNKLARNRKENTVFYFPYYLYVDLEDNCKSDYHHESSNLLEILLNKQKVIAIGHNIYLIRPEYGGADK